MKILTILVVIGFILGVLYGIYKEWKRGKKLNKNIEKIKKEL